MHDPSNEPDLRVLSVLARLEKLALIAVAIVSGGVLGLWWLPSAAAFAPVGWSQMTAATATGMLLASVSLALSASQRSPRALQLSKAAAVAVLALGIIALLKYSGGIAVALDKWPRLPSPQTALGFALTGICMLLIRQAKTVLSTLADICATALAALVLFLLGGHAFGVAAFVGVSATNLTSTQTLFCFLLLAVVIVARQAAGGGLFSILVNGGIGSRIMRVVLPGILALPFLLFMTIEYLNDTGILPTAHTRAMVAPAVALVVLGVVGWMGRITNTLERKLRLQSVTDQLTNVLNRRGFEAVSDYAMRNAKRMGTSMIVFYFDLDGLKQVNDTVGHEAGSVVIRRFADLLVATFRKNDVVARVGGDEFVVLAAGIAGSVADMLARLERSVAECNASGSVPGRISYSAGYAELLPQAASHIDDLVAQADKMMYEQKVRGKAA